MHAIKNKSLKAFLLMVGAALILAGTHANAPAQKSSSSRALAAETTNTKSSATPSATDDYKIFDRGRWRLQSDVFRERAKSYYQKGEKFGLSGRYNEAVEALKEAVRLRPDYTDAWFGLAHAYSDLGRWQEAAEAYQQVIRLDPKDAEARYNLDATYAKMGVKKETTTAAAPKNVPLIILAPKTYSSPSSPSVSGNKTVRDKVATTIKAPSNSSSMVPAAPAKKTSHATPPPVSVVTASSMSSGAKSAPTANAAPAKGATESKTSALTAAAIVKDPTSFYRVAPGDVLDIRLLNTATTNQSTLYTVLENGLLEYPLAGEAISVNGLTTDEIAQRLAASSKIRAVYDEPRIAVAVRQYESHTVIISGLVNDPGTKVLRREAIPLYVVIADAQPRPEANRALLMSHATGQNTLIDLTDPAAMNVLVHPGDVITVQSPSETQTQQFFYIVGLVNDAGQKQFHPGMTLTQAILVAGGVRAVETNTKETSTKPPKKEALAASALGANQSGYVVTIARQDASGRLLTTKYNLEKIKQGKLPDPALQQGDRIEVLR
jgi:protein involved in polysaccharide export with SLBB domain